MKVKWEKKECEGEVFFQKKWVSAALFGKKYDGEYFFKNKLEGEVQMFNIEEQIWAEVLKQIV